MKKLFLLLALSQSFATVQAQENPFAEYGYTPKIATLSQGQFNESFDNDTIVQIGSVLFNTKSKQIVAFVEYDTLYSEATLEPDIVSRWMSPDPLASSYTSLSPYNFVGNNPIYFTDIDGRVIWDPQAKKEVIYNSESNKFTYKDGTELSKAYAKQALPTLQMLTSSQVGKNLIASMQNISTKIIIDETDKKTIRSNPNNNSTVLREIDGNGNFILNEDGLSPEAYIVPNWANIKKNANEDGMDVDEKLLATMVVEFGHMSTKEQISIENSLNDIYSNSSSFAKVYNPLMNSAIKAEIAYRQEKGQEVDLSVFGFYNKISTQDIGSDLKLDSENQKLYNSLKK